jgi:CBS-domain-containing membrane protein
MRSPDGEVNGEAASVAADTVVQDLLPLVADSDRVLRVMDGEETIGVIDRSSVMTALIEER